MPGRWSFQYSLRNEGSVPSFCVTWYWTGVRALRLVVIEDRGAVLGPVIAELGVPGQRIDVAPEHLEQALVADLRGVVDHLDGLRVARRARRDFIVGGVLLVPARVAGRHGEHAVETGEGRFHAPEAASREGGGRAVTRGCGAVSGRGT